MRIVSSVSRNLYKGFTIQDKLIVFDALLNVWIHKANIKLKGPKLKIRGCNECSMNTNEFTDYCYIRDIDSSHDYYSTCCRIFGFDHAIIPKGYQNYWHFKLVSKCRMSLFISSVTLKYGN